MSGESIESIERIEDMSPSGRLVVHRQSDGDMIVAIWPDSKEHPYSGVVSAEFCTYGGGGRSPNTLKALRALFEAIELDNKEYPQDHRS